MTLSEQEQRLERMIDYAAKRVADAPTETGKRHAWRVLKRLTARRSPARIAAMERERNLV